MNLTRPITLSAGLLIAQTALAAHWHGTVMRLNYAHESAFQRDRFEKLDTDRDRRLSVEELSLGDGWRGALFNSANPSRLASADRDSDGLLTFAEARIELAWEKLNWSDMRVESPYDLPGWHNDFGWLAAHPRALASLVASAGYLADHPNMARGPLLSPGFLAENPRVARGLYANKRWLGDNPDVAQELYSRYGWLNARPDIARVAYEDDDWLRANPDIAMVALGNEVWLQNNSDWTDAFYADETWLEQYPQALDLQYGYGGLGLNYPRRHTRTSDSFVVRGKPDQGHPATSPAGRPSNRHHNPTAPATQHDPAPSAPGGLRTR